MYFSKYLIIVLIFVLCLQHKPHAIRTKCLVTT